MKYVIKEYFRKIPDKLLIKDLRKTARKLKKNWVTIREYGMHGKYDPSTLFTKLGGWNAALLKANLKVRFHYNVKKEEMMRNMKIVWDKLGRQPKIKDMKMPLSEYSTSLYISSYGSWIKSLRAFGKWVNKGKNIKAMPALKFSYIKKKRVRRHAIPIGLRYKVLRRDKFKCVLCGKSPVTDPKTILHIDHIKPVSKGGKETMKNLRTLCSKCNLGKMTGD